MAPSDNFARDRSFWIPVLYAVPIGLLAGVAALLFTQAVGRVTGWLWPDDVDNSFLGGDLWWLPVTVAGALYFIAGGLHVDEVRREMEEVEEEVGEDVTDNRQTPAGP